jgi:hypothetical protein
MNPPFHPPSICPSANLSSFTYLIQKLANGALTLHQWFMIILPSLGHHFTLGHPFLYLYIFPQNYFVIYYLLYKHLYLQSIHSLLSPLATCFFGHTQPMSPLDWSNTYHLPSPTSSISLEYPAGQLPLPSEFVHLVPPLAQLSPGLVVPLTLDLVTRLRPLVSSYILQPREVLSHPTS